MSSHCLNQPVRSVQLDQVREVEIDGVHARISYDGTVNPVLHAAMAHDVLNLHSRDADLEEIFLAYYRDTDAATETAAAPDTNASDVKTDDADMTAKGS